jgi:hypothetical protein
MAYFRTAKTLSGPRHCKSSAHVWVWPINTYLQDTATRLGVAQQRLLASSIVCPSSKKNIVRPIIFLKKHIL